MILGQICGRLKALVIVVLAVFKRALCCFSRKRRNSYSDDSEVLQMVSVVNQNTGGSSRKTGEVSLWEIFAISMNLIKVILCRTIGIGIPGTNHLERWTSTSSSIARNWSKRQRPPRRRKRKRPPMTSFK